MGVCQSKNQVLHPGRKVHPRLIDHSQSSPQPRVVPNPSRILDLNYSQIPNKFKKTSSFVQDQNSEQGGLIGLRNTGNSCFMNSQNKAIQLLSHTEPLTDYFISDLHTSEINPNNPLSSKGQVTQTFARLIKLLWEKARVQNPTKENQNMINPHELTKTMQKWAPQFSNGTQEDSHEFLAFLLDMIHEDLNRVKQKPYIVEKEYTGLPNQNQADESWQSYLMRNRSVIVDLFQGQQKSSLKCGLCQYQSHRYEPFMYLSLPVIDESQENTCKPPYFIEDCIKEYCKEVTNNSIQGKNYLVKNNGSVHNVKPDLWAMPNILIMHLKRFKFTREKRCKLRTFIDFPLTGLNFEKITMGKQNEAPTYDLYGVINHEGSLGRGHYYSYAKNRDDLNWYCFNDSQVSMVQDPDDQVVSNDAYLLFFYKNSVNEFKRQTLTSEQLQNLEEISPNKKLITPKVAFQKSLKNSMSIRFKTTTKVAKSKERSVVLDDSQNFSINQENLKQNNVIHREQLYNQRKSIIFNKPNDQRQDNRQDEQLNVFNLNVQLKRDINLPYQNSTHSRQNYQQQQLINPEDTRSQNNQKYDQDKSHTRLGLGNLKGNQKQKKQIKISLPNNSVSDEQSFEDLS